jgi:hypothetical protein
MPSKKRVHLQQSGIISQKHVSWDAKSHTHLLQSSLIHQNKVTMRPYLHDEICKITHTHWSCSQVVDLAARGHRTSSISVDGLETWFLAWLIKESLCLATIIFVCKTEAFLNYPHLTRKNNEICFIQILATSSSYKWTQEKDKERVETYPLKNPSSWRRRGKQKEAQVWRKSCSRLSVGLFILMLGGSGLPSPDIAASKGYVTRILLAAVFEGWATKSPPITRILLGTKRLRRRKKR